MPKLKKIDKKKAVTFQLVHRSQQDPLVADENAPQRVLLPVEDKRDKEKRLEEQHKYGIYFDDDCDYLEHLKNPKDTKMQWPEHVEEELANRIERTKAQLPQTVFASQREEEIGMLAKAAPVSGPQLHLDPDVVAAMDDDFDYFDPENQLEDNFVELAMGIASDQEFDENDESDMDSNFDEEDNAILSDVSSGQSFEQEETKSRFTNYSMTSSVMRRNDQLSLLDERFEKMYADYEDNEIGALDCEEIEGYVPETADILLKYADEFEKSQKKEQIDQHSIASKIKEQLETFSDEEEELVAVPVPEKVKWDCESILSTYSNLYNHPKLISESKNKITIDKKTGVPKNILGTNKLTVQAVNELNEQNTGFSNKGTKSVGGQSIISHLSTLSIRPKGESPEDRKERKKLLKDYRKERRLEKKINTEAFKEEKQRQIKININNKNNVQGNKIL